jgi:hypothetical protein
MYLKWEKAIFDNSFTILKKNPLQVPVESSKFSLQDYLKWFWMINRKSRGAQVKLEPWRKQRLKKDEHAKQKWKQWAWWYAQNQIAQTQH